MSDNLGNSSSPRMPVLSALRVLIVLSFVFLVWSSIRLEPWSRPSMTQDTGVSNVPWTDVNPLGVNTFLAREVEPWKRERTFAMASDAGVGWIKEHFPWRDIETAQDSYWDANFQQDAWAKYDAIVDGAERHGLRIIARIDLAPQWARTRGSSHTAPPANYADFADFVAVFVERYKGRVQFLQIWNEPNLAAEWGGEIDPLGYADLLTVAATAAREVDPDVVILSAPLAMTTENSERAMDDLMFWRMLYDAGAGPHFDIMSANAYGLDQRYDAPPSESTLNIRRIELLHEIAAENNDERKPIWLNEYGWNASPQQIPASELIWSRVSESEQAKWTADGTKFLRDEYRWFGVANVWYFRQVGDIGIERSDYYFRAVDVEFTPRLLYRSIADLGNQLRYAGPGVHNDLEAPFRPSGTWAVRRDPDSIAGEHIVGATGSTMTISVEVNQVIALLSGRQRATTIAVRDSRSEGTSKEISIASGQQTVELVSWSEDQAPQQRTIELEVTGRNPLLLDGIDAHEHRSSRTLLVSIGALIASVSGFIVLRKGTDG